MVATVPPGGVDFKREAQLFTKAGEAVEVSVDGLGSLKNPVVDEF